VFLLVEVPGQTCWVQLTMAGLGISVAIQVTKKSGDVMNAT